MSLRGCPSNEESLSLYLYVNYAFLNGVEVFILAYSLRTIVYHGQKHIVRVRESRKHKEETD